MQATLTVQSEAVPVIRSSIDMKRKALEYNLRQYQARLAAFERQHQMTSEQLVAKFNAGELGDGAEWFEWEFVLDACRETTRQLGLLVGVNL